MTRIIAGQLGGQRLKTPKTAATRPTSDRVREAVFSRLEGWGVLAGAGVLDVYAGSGALGFEALSRGAANATFVEFHAQTAAVIRSNAAALNVAERSQVVVARAETYAAQCAQGAFSVAFVDAPYEIATATIDTLVHDLCQGALTHDATLVVERSKRSEPITWPANVDDLGAKVYGETTIFYGAYIAASESEQ